MLREIISGVAVRANEKSSEISVSKHIRKRPISADSGQTKTQLNYGKITMS